MSASRVVVLDPPPLARIERFVDADTAANFLGITRRTLLQKVRAGKIPGYPLDRSARKKEWRFKLSELDHCLGAQVHSIQQPT
jgi:excisionase family DNA binding protein